MSSKAVGIWIRVSTEDQARGESPEHHEKRARFYAESKDWNIREVYHLEAVSGKSVMEHPEAKRMLKDIKSGHISGLIFSKLARLARNTRELLEFADIFREYDADLISLQESIDTSTPAGRLFYTMIAAMAQWEREEIASRINASVTIRAKLGKLMNGAAPFGYDNKDRQLLPNPKEAPVAKLLYELFLQHHRKKTAARMLNDMGHRTKSESKFSDTTVNRILTDPTYKGIHRINFSKSMGVNKSWVYKPKEEWNYLKVEPIVSEELWDQCNSLLEKQGATRKKPTKQAVYLFTGYLTCECGGKMTVPSNLKKYSCQKCKSKIPITDMEEVYHEELKNFLFSQDELTAYLSKGDEIIKGKEELLKSMENQKQGLLVEKEKVYRAYIGEKINMDAFGEQYNPLLARIKEIEKQMPELQGEIDFLKIQYLNRSEILSEARDLHSKWKELTFEEKRKIVENITENIIIGKEDIAINLCYLPSPSELTTDRQHKQ
jgi:site-specific DNA recombinase